jgi:hypothetical protein
MGTMIHAFASDPMTTYACPGMEFDSPAWRAGSAASREVAARATAEDLDTLGGLAHRFEGPVLILAGDCSTWIGEEHSAGASGPFHRRAAGDHPRRGP